MSRLHSASFSTPAATVEFAALAAQARAVHVIGTTGLEAEHLAKIEAASRHAVIVRAGNMSLGVNLLVRLTQMDAESCAHVGLSKFDILPSRAEQWPDAIAFGSQAGLGWKTITSQEMVNLADVLATAKGLRAVLRLKGAAALSADGHGELRLGHDDRAR